ncbi:trans-sialidase, putative [Trypanosoma cruzi marinkellei]|uniref:Trans-sialidase, putative n=1 Tax=Trypanosoma cruzi marinkellei TaxID=85056 RepID=K2N6Z7_TRYCR|nr:trans-sialidase, putative [Trypanosoma cruzi marinkellei]
MGRTWTEAVGALPGVWTGSQSGVRWDRSLHVDALIAATIGKRKVMLYGQRRRYFSGTREATALYLWVTDNNRSFYVGPVTMEDEASWMLPSNLLYSDGNLHLLQRRDTSEGSAISLSRLAEELNTIKYVLSTWAQLDASFSGSSIPTAGLVGFLSNASSGDVTWIDEYHCVNATVTKAARVAYGFKFTGPGSGAMWPVNGRKDNNQYGFVSHDFTLLATVTIHEVPKGSTPQLGASLGDGAGKKIIVLSYSMKKMCKTVFNGTKTAPDSTWDPGREHRVALVLQGGNKGSVYVDGVHVGSSAKLPTPDTRGREITHFSIGGDKGDTNSSVTVTNVFLYNRPLSVGEIKMVKRSDDKKGGGDGSMRGGVSQLLLLLLLGLCSFVALY